MAMSLQAQNIDQVYLNNGSVYEGYISEQVPGDYIAVKAEMAEICLDTSKVSKVTPVRMYLSELSESAQTWLKANRPETDPVEMVDVLSGDTLYENAVLLEKGSRLKFIYFPDAECKLPWREIYKTTKTEKGLNASTGIVDVITLKNGKYIKGYIVEQILGDELKVRTFDNLLSSVKYSDILCINSEQIGKNKSLWSQIMFLDRVELRNGEIVEGFIASRLMGKHMSIAVKDNAMERYVPLKDVAKYYKIYNMYYEDPANQAAYGEEEEEAPVAHRTMEERIYSISVGSTTFTPTEIEQIDDLYYLSLGTSTKCEGDRVKITIPLEDFVAPLKIVKLEQLSGDELGSYSKVDSPWGFIWNEDLLEFCDYFISALDSYNLELTLEKADAGVYIILPFIKDGICAAFEIVKE